MYTMYRPTVMKISDYKNNITNQQQSNTHSAMKRSRFLLNSNRNCKSSRLMAYQTRREANTNTQLMVIIMMDCLLVK